MAFFGALIAIAFAVSDAAAAPQGAATQEPVRVISEASATLEADGAAPVEVGKLELSHRWDADPRTRARSGRATYRMVLPPTAGAGPKALLFTRVGNQVEVLLNGALVLQLGRLGDAGFDAAKSAHRVPLPTALLKAEQPNQLVIHISAQASRWGGLSSVRYGPADAIEHAYRGEQRWRAQLPLVLGVGCLGVAVICAALWVRQREALYGWAVAAALFGLVRPLDRLWADVPVPWPAWGALVALCYAVHMVLISRTVVLICEGDGPSLKRLCAGTLIVSPSLCAAGVLLHRPELNTWGLVVLFPYGLAAAYAAVRLAPRGGYHWALLPIALLVFAAAVHDFGGVRLGFAASGSVSLMPAATLLVLLTVVGAIVQRFNATASALRAINSELDERIRRRELELGQAFQRLHAQERERAVQEERQRTMRELHDGVGSQLVALLNLASRGKVDANEVENQARLALDELRIAVDALQPMHGNLATVLAALRYRLQTRLETAGITVEWDMPSLPNMDRLTPQAALQVQRIVLEAVTNVIKHARATRLTLRVRWHEGPPGAVQLEVSDNGLGIGLPHDGEAPTGRGLSNMYARAEAIGAKLHIAPHEPKGTCVRLVWPMEV